MMNDEKPARSHKDLPVWQRAMTLAEYVFELTEAFSDSEPYGLAHSLRATAIAVPSYIAEGAGRSSSGDLGHYLGLALGEVAKVETQIELAIRLKVFSDANDAVDALEEVRKQLIVYRRSLRA